MAKKDEEWGIEAPLLDERLLEKRLDRRRFMKAAGLSGAALGLSGFLAACKNAVKGGTNAAAVKIGYVSPKTGPFSEFGQADAFTLSTINQIFSKGFKVAGSTRSIKIIISKDSQSDPNRAAQVASDLINNDQIDLMVVSSTPETTNPVADQCEAAGVPCISTVTPWQPYFFGRQKDPANPVPFKYTYHFFWGLEDIEQVFFNMWETIPTNKKVAGLFPNDGDGNAWGDKALGFPSFFGPKGYPITDPGRFQTGTQDFSAQISQYKRAGAEILTGVPIPPDFTNFWKQANQQGFVPKIASVGKALLFPSGIEALGSIGEGLSSEVWWTPSHPFSSSLTGQSAQQLGDAYTKATGKQWTQPVGFAHALFEVAADVLKRASAVTPDAIVAAIKETNLDTIVGHIQWTGQPFPNVAKTKLCGGQWKKGTQYPYDLVVVENSALPGVPIGGQVEPIPGSS
jgi:branched-chain amino acid transport system substrate-binding protein